jgi:hypothetical protein
MGRSSTSTLDYNTERQELKQAWGDFLGKMANWDWFATLTFRDPGPGNGNWTKPGWGYAKNAFKGFVAAVQPVLGAAEYVRMFELQKERGVPHIHALLSSPELPRRDEAWAWWWGRYGFARILPYDHKLGARYYLCKYISKDIADIEFSPGLDNGCNGLLQSGATP